jgi:hypothetical protein
MSRKYKMMNTNDGDDVGDGGNVAVDDEDDFQSSKDSSGSEDRCPSANSPSRSLSEVRFFKLWCL